MLPESRLSAYEEVVVADKDFMYARNSIIKKVITSFGHLADAYKPIAFAKLQPEWLQVAPKITRGEQYLQLPYVMLDYPRNFTRDNKFAIRTLFWWGNHFSIHLHLSGLYQNIFTHQLYNALNNGLLSSWYMCVNANEWEHHFNDNNYVQVDRSNAQQLFFNRPFIKLAKKIPLSEWNKADKLLLESFIGILNLIQP